MTTPVYLALGSNLGNRLDELQQAVERLGTELAIEAISPVYETAPWGIEEQPNFYNLCLRGRTRLDPRGLLAKCKEVEQSLGRKAGPRYGPRLIDVDILYYGRKRYDEDGLTVPHPRLAERAFVLAPLADIAAEFEDPLRKKTVAELLAALDTTGIEQLGPDVRVRRPIWPAWGIKTYVMGILNATPDSFSGDGVLQREGERARLVSEDAIGAAVAQAQSFVEAGADVIDIGAESTRPGSQPISPDEEMARLIPIVAAVRAAVDVPISVDTYRADVAEAALESGGDWINDVWALRMDRGMGELVAHSGCPVILMHNRSRPKNVAQEARLGGRYEGIEYDDLLNDIENELRASLNTALESGIQLEQIMLDPGIGFGKTVSQNLTLLRRLDAFKALGRPLLAGPSRKSFIGYTLELPPEQRMEGTAAAVAIAIDRGADIVRVHDVKEMVRVARMTDAIVR
ncbi:MAG: dihydropteroate synthase [Candidatus Promineifilaceae bacterium]|nr:dihydropteroate synthase [Candidatus Promineifilaceae bacterium]